MFDFESRLKSKLLCVDPLTVRLVEHCADVLNRYNIGADGRNALPAVDGQEVRGAHVGVWEPCNV